MVAPGVVPLPVLLDVGEGDGVCVWLTVGACVDEPLPVLDGVKSCVRDCVTLPVDVTVGDGV